MTTTIRTSHSDIALTDSVGAYFWDCFSKAPDTDACLLTVRDYIVDYVNNNLPDNLTWYPSTSEILVEFDPDETDYIQEQFGASEDVEDMVQDLINEAMQMADGLLDKDPDCFGRHRMTLYEQLVQAATGPKATQEDISRLGDWLCDQGNTYWNGEYYDADGLRVYPVYVEQGKDEFFLTGYEIR